jgi:hypothetical protein
MCKEKKGKYYIVDYFALLGEELPAARRFRVFPKAPFQ